MSESYLPRVVTFDGEARSGKGTIVSATKDYLRDEEGYDVMLIDAGQIFRVLVIAAGESGVNLYDPTDIDKFLSDETKCEAALLRVKEVYHMPKEERQDLLYTKQVNADSAKVGARPGSQDFKDGLLTKWVRDARTDAFESFLSYKKITLIDGRALEPVGKSLAEQKLCRYILGFYSICDPIVGARRHHGYAEIPYPDLSLDKRQEVDSTTTAIKERNRADMHREVQPLVRPSGAPLWDLADNDNPPTIDFDANPPIITIDTSAEIGREAMSMPVAKFVAGVLRADSIAHGHASKQFAVPANFYAS